MCIIEKDGQLYFERGDGFRREVFRQSELFEGMDDNSLEGAGYVLLKKMYLGRDIAGYDEIGEPLYIVADAPYIRS